LLEDERIGIDGISATSAGAMNATVFASGIAAGAATARKRRSPSYGDVSAMQR
jgi:NTE family protein